MFVEGTESGGTPLPTVTSEMTEDGREDATGKPLPTVSYEMTEDGREDATTAMETGCDPLSPTAESAEEIAVVRGRVALSTSEDRERGRMDPFSLAEPEMAGVGGQEEGTDDIG